ncbi:MAG: phosphate acyltransferase PlsX, partial [Vulcanococcus sp.]
MPPKPSDIPGSGSRRGRPRAIRRLVIWYRRNAAVTSLVGTATATANAAGSMAGSMAGSAAGAAGAAAGAANTVLQPLVFDPLRRLQRGVGGSEGTPIDDADRLWVAVDGMGGDYAPGPILEGCLRAVRLLPLRVKFVAEAEAVAAAVADLDLTDELEAAQQDGLLQLVPSGVSVGMNEVA